MMHYANEICSTWARFPLAWVRYATVERLRSSARATDWKERIGEKSRQAVTIGLSAIVYTYFLWPNGPTFGPHLA
jgi:hypothetical protein